MPATKQSTVWVVMGGTKHENQGGGKGVIFAIYDHKPTDSEMAVCLESYHGRWIKTGDDWWESYEGGQFLRRDEHEVTCRAPRAVHLNTSVKEDDTMTLGADTLLNKYDHDRIAIAIAFLERRIETHDQCFVDELLNPAVRWAAEVIWRQHQTVIENQRTATRAQMANL